MDWENIAEEIESLGKSERRELSSQIRRILRHLYKLESSSAGPPREGWRATVRAARADALEVLEESPSLGREVGSLIEKQTQIAADLAAADFARHGEAAEAVRAKFAQGGFTTDEVLGDWLPNRR